MPKKRAEAGSLFGESEPKPECSKPKGDRPTREIWRLLKYYDNKVRHCSKADFIGVIRNIQRLIDKGIGMETIATALENYANDEWRQAQDPRYSLAPRSFFSEAKIKEWETPRPSPKPVRPQIQFEAIERPAPVIPVTELETEASDEL